MKSRKIKTVILDGFSVTQNDEKWTALEEITTLTVYPRTNTDETIARCKDAEAVLTNKVQLSRKEIEALPTLRYIGVLATGYNVVDCEAAREHGIIVANIPAYSTESVAQLVFAHLLNITNSVAHYAEARDKWPASPDFSWIDTQLTELAGKTFGIHGLGNIGTAVARIAHAFGMRVIAVTSRQSEALPPGVEKAAWSDVLREADVLSLHCPLTPQTREIINNQALAMVKPTAILINTGRGPLVNEEAVARALYEHRLAAYCADVLSTEPPSPENPLLTAPRCFLTPHLAWATREARKRLIATATRNLQAYLDGQPVNVVNK